MQILLDVSKIYTKNKIVRNIRTMFLDVEHLFLRSLSLALPLTAVSILIKELIVSGEVVLNDQFLNFFLNFRNEMRLLGAIMKVSYATPKSILPVVLSIGFCKVMIGYA